MTPTTLLMGQILVVFGIVISGTWIATQWTAAALGYQLRLGTPWFQFGALPVYYPWRLLEWWYAYEAYAPAVFNRGGLIAAAAVLAIPNFRNVRRSRFSEVIDGP